MIGLKDYLLSKDETANLLGFELVQQLDEESLYESILELVSNIVYEEDLLFASNTCYDVVISYDYNPMKKNPLGIQHNIIFDVNPYKLTISYKNYIELKDYHQIRFTKNDQMIFSKLVNNIE